MGYRAHNILTFKMTSDNIYHFYADSSPLIDEFWTALSDLELVRNARMRALKRVIERIIFQRLRRPPTIYTVFMQILPQ